MHSGVIRGGWMERGWLRFPSITRPSLLSLQCSASSIIISSYHSLVPACLITVASPLFSFKFSPPPNLGRTEDCLENKNTKFVKSSTSFYIIFEVMAMGKVVLFF